MKKEFDVDLKGVRSSRAFHARLAKALPLPETYGRNADALYDVLTEFGGDWQISFRNAQGVPQLIRTVCADATEDTPGLVIRFEPE